MPRQRDISAPGIDLNLEPHAGIRYAVHRPLALSTTCLALLSRGFLRDIPAVWIRDRTIIIEEIKKLMKTGASKLIILLVGGFLFAWACAPRPAVVTEPVPVYPGRNTVLEADGFFEARDYEKALEYYQLYLDQYPDGPAAATVLLRIGTVKNALGQYASARDSFDRLLADYPRNELAGDARVGILASYYGEGLYDNAVRLGAMLLEQPMSKGQEVRTHEILGDTYLALQSPEDAVYFYTIAYRSAEAPQSTLIGEKLKTAINLLRTSDIVALLGHVQDDLPRSYLMYQLGVNLIAESNYDQAAQALSDFLAAYPTHEYNQQARRMLEELSGRTVYNRTTIGCLLPLSGRYEVYGEKAMKGIEIALARFNQLTIGGLPVQLIVKDSGSDPGTLTAAIEELVQARVAAIIGPLVDAEYAAEIAQKNGIPIITLTQKENITKVGDWVFRNFITPEMQVKRIVGYASDVLGAHNFVILYPEEKYGATFMNLFWDEVTQHGGRVVGVESYNPSQTDFAEPIKKLVGQYYDTPEDLKDIVRPPQDSGTVTNAEQETSRSDRGRREEEGPKAIVDFDAIFIPDAPAKAGLIVPQLAYYDIENVYLLGTNLWHSPKMIEMARDYVQGAIMPDGFFPDSQNPRVKEFVKLFEDTYAETPGVIEATAYDSAMMFFQICQHPDVQSRTAIKEELLRLRDFPGVTGLTSFDGQREAIKKLSMLRIEGDGFVELQ
jgi:ABC-type branched-subunit amino acid transport system substrate-binding protein/predicted negative regulator of RcsB-dependent stress response